jgi:outer membrane lipoprotein-sorting protein
MKPFATLPGASNLTGSGWFASERWRGESKSGEIMYLRVRRVIFGVVAAVALASFASAQDATLEHILTEMDTAAKDFRSLQATFVWDQFTKVVKETDTSKGSVYFQREGSGIKMAADITDPAPKAVLFADGEVKMYEPKVDHVTSYKTGKDRGEVESFLLLGFGGRGHDLLKSYDVKYIGKETIDGVETAQLELVPKSEKVRGHFSQILLWIDGKSGVAVQQKLLQPSGDFRLAKYSKILINQKLPDGVFKLKTTPKTTYLAPQG